jgi:hypothetical protein
MTYIKPEIDPIPTEDIEDIEVMARRMEAAAQKQVALDIARLKSMGLPIHYMISGKLIREEADGRKFEIELQPDGSEKIIGTL